MRDLKKLVVALALLSLAGCAHHYSDNLIDDPYGFFSGIWHGIVSPFTTVLNIAIWVVSFFDEKIYCNVEIIGQPNTGVFYYAGFLTGLGAWSIAS